MCSSETTRPRKWEDFFFTISRRWLQWARSRVVTYPHSNDVCGAINSLPSSDFTSAAKKLAFLGCARLHFEEQKSSDRKRDIRRVFCCVEFLIDVAAKIATRKKKERKKLWIFNPLSNTLVNSLRGCFGESLRTREIHASGTLWNGTWAESHVCQRIGQNPFDRFIAFGI